MLRCSILQFTTLFQGYRHKGAGESSRRPHDNGSARDYVKSRNRRHDSDIFQSDFDRINGEPKSGLTGIVNVHRFNVNVYSSDAQIFYREGELELYMAYRFPQVDPVTGKRKSSLFFLLIIDLQ